MYGFQTVNFNELGKNPPGILIQPFIKEMESKGELSFIYLNGFFTHCVLNRKKLIYPSSSILKQANRIFQKLGLAILYARLDLINIKVKLHVNEIELIEPELFFSFYPPSASLFARAIDKLINLD